MITYRVRTVWEHTVTLPDEDISHGETIAKNQTLAAIQERPSKGVSQLGFSQTAVLQ